THMPDEKFFIAKDTGRESCAHAAHFGFESEVIDVEVGLFEDLLEDLVGLCSRSRALESIQSDIDRHLTGDFTGTQAADTVCNRSDCTLDELVVFVFRFPETNGILVVVTDGAC